MAYTDYLDTVQKCYIAYYQRPADPGGLDYWAKRLDAAHGDLAAIIDAFANSTESTSLYGTINNTTIGSVVNHIYLALFNRNADAGGLSFYTAAFASGHFSDGRKCTQGTIVLDILGGAQASDLQSINNKVAVADVFTNRLDTAIEIGAYSGTKANDVARLMLTQVSADTNPATFYRVDDAINSIVAGTVQQTFTLTETYTPGTADVPEVKAIYWGYNPHPHDETSGVDNTAGGNTSNLTNEGPQDGGIPVADMVNFLTTITGLDLKELGLIDANGVDPFQNVTNISFALGDIEAGKGGDIEIKFLNGQTVSFSLNAEVALGAQYFAFLNNLLFDQEGNSRLFEKVVVPAMSGTSPALTPIVLTPYENNGGTVEVGFTTTPGNDTIVAGRLELLHGAYIDGGAGYDTLEIDAKGTYAQPKELLNIEEIHIQNMANVYTVDDGEGGGYLDNTKGISYGDEIPNLADYVPGTSSTTGSVTSSFVDITRATSLEKLVVNEAAYDNNPKNYPMGPLTVIGIRNDATTRLEGSFIEAPVYLQYGQGQHGILNLELALGTVDVPITLLQNAPVINIDSQGLVNYMNTFFAGGEISRMYITGTGAFGVDGNIAASFNKNHPVLIDANGYSIDSNGDGVLETYGANTGGIDITLGDENDVAPPKAGDYATVDAYAYGGVLNDNATVYGTAARDEIQVETAFGDLYVDAGEGNNWVKTDTDEGNITVNAGAGDDYIYADSDKLGNIKITAGDGANQIVAYTDDEDTIDSESTDTNFGNITITAGAGADNIYADAEDGNLSIAAAGGNNYIEAYTNSYFEDAGNILITTNGGDDTIRGEAEEYGGVTIAAGDGANLVDFTSGYGNMKITTGAGNDIIYAYGYDNTNWPCDTTTTIDSGAGDDNIYAEGVSSHVLVTVTSGTGNDQVEISAYKSVITTGAGNDTVVVDGQSHSEGSGTNATTVVDPITFTIDTGTDVDKVIFNDGTKVIANPGSSIKGSSITLDVQEDADLSRATLSGITAVSLGKDEVLTLTAAQFVALGPDKFSVQGSTYGNAAEVKIVVGSDFTLGDMTDLGKGVKLVFVIKNDATLTLSAEQLHYFVAVDGIDATDGLNGKVVVTGAGMNFNVFTGGEDLDDGVADGMYYQLPLFGSLSDTFATSDDITIIRTPGGFNRPVPGVSTDTSVIDSTGTETYHVTAPVILGGKVDNPTTLKIIGNQDVVFDPGTYVDLGTEGNAINFSGLDEGKTVTGLVVKHFENISSVAGNFTDTRINVELTGDVASSEQGLVTSGVEEYVVTLIDTPAIDAEDPTNDVPANTAHFWLCDETQDVEVIGLKGNAGATLIFEKVPWGLVHPSILLEGDGYADWDDALKVDGNPNTSDIGNIVVNYFTEGAPAIVNINNGGVELGETSTGGERYFNVGSITLTDAASLELNVTEGDAKILDINGDSGLKSFTVTASEDEEDDAADVTITDALPTSLTIINAAGVTGIFTATIDDPDAAFTFTGAAGGSNLTLEDMEDAAYVIGGAGDVTLTIKGDVDLDEGTLASSVKKIYLEQGADLDLTVAQATAIGAANILLAPGASSAFLDLTGLDGELFTLADYEDGIVVDVFTVAALPNVTLNPLTDLTGITELEVLEGTTLNLTAAQYQELTGKLGVKIFGDGVVNITDLTQTDVAGGFNLDGVTANCGTVTLAEDVRLTSSDSLGNFLNINIGDFALTLGDIYQADGVSFTGSATSVLAFTDISEPNFAHIDASGFNVGFLKVLNALVENKNVDYLFSGLPGSVKKEIFVDIGQLEYIDQIVTIDAKTTVDGNLIFNQASETRVIRNFTLNLEGGTELMGNLRLSTTEKLLTDMPVYLDTLTIKSEGTDADKNLLSYETANIIDGDITPLKQSNPLPYVSADNNLLNVTLDATQVLDIKGDIIFHSVNVPTNPLHTATLNVEGSAAVSVEGGLDTLDGSATTGVTALNVVHTGTGAMNLTIDGSDIDPTDAITIAGSGAADNLTIEDYVDFSDDTLSSIDSVKIEDGAELVITQTQFDAIGAANFHDAPHGKLDIVELGTTPFDARLPDPLLDVYDVTVKAGDITLNGATNLTGVDHLFVHEGSTVSLTGAQFNQLVGSGTINGLDDDGDTVFEPFTVNITGITQADIDAGFSLAGIAAQANVNLTFAGDVDLADGTALGDLSRLHVILAAGQSLGLANSTQADGLWVTGEATSTLVYQFDTMDGGDTQIDASNYFGIGTLKALTTFVDNTNVEFLIDNLASSIVLRLYNTPEELGFLSDTNRIVFMEAGNTVPGYLVFNDWDPTDEVRTALITMDGGDEIQGNISLPTRSNKDPNLIQRFFDTLTITSQGTAANLQTGETYNKIDGNIDTFPNVGTYPQNEGNNLLNLIVNATQDFIIGGNVVFASVGGDAYTDAHYTQTGSADVTVTKFDVSDNDIDSLSVANNGTGSLTLLGASAAIFDDKANTTNYPDVAGANLETLTFSGTGDVAIGDMNVNTSPWGISAADLSVINASGLSGSLSLGEARDIDSEDFALTAGSGATLFRLTEDTLSAGLGDEGWSFDFGSATGASEFHLGGAATPLIWTSGALNIDLGAHTTLYIDETTNWTSLDDVDITQSLDIVLADGKTLTLTADEADGLSIVAGPDTGGAGITAKVNIVGLVSGQVYDFSGIAANIAGSITLGENDVTVDPATNLGSFAIDLTSNSDTVGHSGQTIRFNTIAQAERTINVDGGQAGDAGVDSSNVIWLFSDNLHGDSIDTSHYSADLGRLWLSDAFIAANGGDVENLFTTLPYTVLRVDFATLAELEILINANEVNRTMEIVSFKTLGNVLFSDTGANPEEFIKTLDIKMGGQATTGSINLDDVVSAEHINLASISFDWLKIDSERALSSDNILAPTGFVQNNNGVNEYIGGHAENIQPANLNTVGAIGVGAHDGVDLKLVKLDTHGISVVGDGSIGDGADLNTGRITYDSELAADTAELDVLGANDITVAAVDTTDTHFTTAVVDATGLTGTLTVTGVSPAMALGTVEELDIKNGGVTNDAVTLTVPSADATDDPNETITIFYTLNGVAHSLVIDDTPAVDVSTPSAVATAIASALDGINGVTAGAVGADVTANADAGYTFSVDSVKVFTAGGLIVDITDPTTTDGGMITFGTGGHAGVSGAQVSTLDANNFGGTFNAGVLLVDSTNDDDPATPGPDTLLPAFTFDSGNGVTTATLGAADGAHSTLEGGSQWIFDYTDAAPGSSLTITPDAEFKTNPDPLIGEATLTLKSVPLVIQGDVDLTDVILDITGGSISVGDGQSLHLTVAQAVALGVAGVDVIGAGTVYIEGDASNVAGTALGLALKTVGVDISGVTLIASPTLGFDTDDTAELSLGNANTGTIAVPVAAGRVVTGSPNKDYITFTGNKDSTVTAAGGDDTIDESSFGGSLTTHVTAGDDHIIGLYGAVSSAPGTIHDIVTVSSGATVHADVALGDVFVATAATENDGTGFIQAQPDGGGLVDMTLAGGSNGWNLTGGAGVGGPPLAKTAGDALTGSNQADVINGGNARQEAAGIADTLTGNAGADVFAFDLTQSIAAAMAWYEVDPLPVTQETTTVTADNIYEGTETITYNYTLNNNPAADVVIQGVDTTNATNVATAIAAAFDGLPGIHATSAAAKANIIGDGNNYVELNSAVITGDTGINLGVALGEGPDTAETARLDIGPASSDPAVTAGEKYHAQVDGVTGYHLGADYVATTGDTVSDVATALAAALNGVAGGEFTATAGVGATSLKNGMTIVDDVPDNGGFTVSFSGTGIFDGSGASNKGATDPTTADTITDFATGVDSISLGIVAGSDTNYAEHAAYADYATALTAATAHMDGTVQYFLTADTADNTGLLFFDANKDGTVDGVIKLTNITEANFAPTDIVV